MKKVIKIVYLIFSLLIGLGFSVCGYSQIVLSTPSIGFTKACASSSFNTYNLSFSVAPITSLESDNVFIVEMSNATGSFATPVIVATLPNATTSTVVSGSFSIPTDSYGEGYRIRVRSTNPVKTSGSSTAFPAYYAIHNQPFSINNNIGTVNICSGTDFNLSIDNTGTPASPLYYPQLTYKWYKDMTEIPGQTGSSITVTESGDYYAITNYGTCVMNSYSNIVTVSIQSILTPQITTSDGLTTLCGGTTKTLTSDVQDSSFTYTWYRDNIIIPGAILPTYDATQGGIYYLVITGGGCVFETNDIELDEINFNLDIDPAVPVTIIPGQSITLTGINDAVNPTYQWYKNTTAISGATQMTYSATQQGTYKIAVTEPVPCNNTKEATVIVNYPDSFNLAIQAAAGYQSCISTSATLNITQFEAVIGAVTTNLIGNSYGYGYQWYKDDVAVAGATTTQLIVNSAVNNGNYTLKVTLPDYGVITSNVVAVNLAIANVTITGPTTICEGAIVALTSSVTDASYAYQWYRDGVLLSAATTPTLAADAAGDYYLRITAGGCTTQSNTIHIDVESISISSTNPATDTILPGQTKTLTVTTDAAGPVYVWYRNNVVIDGATSATYTATLDGTYKVVVTQTTGCAATGESVFILNYPSAFTLTVAADAAYTACSSTIATVSLTAFTATTPSGNVNVAGLGYAYQWYRNNVVVTGATSASLIISSAAQNGTYRLEATVPSFGVIVSNNVVINLAAEAVVITNASGLCEGSTVAITSSITNPGYTYQWYKDGLAIAGETTSSLTVSTAGDYYLIITGGICTSQSNTIGLTVAGITVSTTNPATDTIMPGQPKTLSVTTDAVAPVYVWYRNNILIPGATSATYSATQDGTYKVVVTQSVGCAATGEKIFILTYPTGFTITIAANAAYVPCMSNSVTLSIASFTATTPTGTVNVSSLGYAYQWYKGSTPVTGATGSTLFLNNAAQNGSYKVVVTIPDFAPVNSNSINVNIAIPAGGLTIVKSGNLCEGSTVTLSSNITDAAYTYQWSKDGVVITGVNAPVLTASTAGDYQLVVTSGSCTSQSNVLHLTVSGITISSVNPAVDTILPGATKIITVTTDAALPVYTWYRNNVLLSETTETLTATLDGEYKVVVTQTAGCAAVQEKIFILQYPQGFQITIAADGAYTECTSAAASVLIASFTAQTPNGDINVTVPGYLYQWYKDDVAIAGETSTTLSLSGIADNGEYKLQVTIPQFAPIFSNTIVIKLAIDTVTITAAGALCEGSTVALTSNTTNPAYAYQWYKGGVAEPGATAPVYTASVAGDYYLTVTNNGCTSQSNTLAIEQSTFSITATSPLSDIIIPGETKVLSVTTDALQPTFAWYRNGVLIPGQTTASITATLAGEYKVVVTQNQDCIISKELLFDLTNPSGFALTIAYQDYQSCVSTEVNLFIAEFKAVTDTGVIDLVGNNFGYGYQWYKDGGIIPGATEVDYLATQTGIYTLEVNIPGFGIVTSNGIVVELAFVESVTISMDEIFCTDGTEVTIYSDVTNQEYLYAWYHNNTSIIAGADSSITVSEMGTYYLEVIYNGCTITSNELVLEPFDMEQITIDVPPVVGLPEGTSIIVTASGAEEYTWYHNGDEISTDDHIEVTEPGSYMVKVQVGECEVTRAFVVTIIENTLIAIPNLITPNNDGINDKWAIPLKYLNEDTEVVVYAPDGAIVLKESHYNNNWPEEDFVWSRKNSVYYYTIMEDNVITRRGSITIVR